MTAKEIWKKHIWKGIFHPEIEIAVDISYEQKENLQFILETDFDGDFNSMMREMWAYALSVEDYESATEIRDYFKEIEEQKI